MERKEKILSYLKSKEYIPLKFGELMTVLDVPKEADAEFLEILNELEEEQKIFVTKKGKYVPVEGEACTAVGTLRCNAKGYFAFLVNEDPNQDDVYISGDKLGYALDGDRVLVQIDELNGKTKRKEGHVLKILERANKVIVGVVTKEKDNSFRVRADNRQFYTKVRVLPENMADSVVGDRVAVEITEYTKNGKVFGTVIKRLGDEESLKGCVEAIIFSNGLKQEFEEQTSIEAEAIVPEVTQKDIEGRADLRQLLTFTIDGDDAKDFDDAVSLEMTPEGKYHLGVHIADVTHYVREGTSLDAEAFERGTSVYLADRVIPMLPRRLSNGICSLNPNVDRLTLSLFMDIDQNGVVTSHRLEKAVIQSKERMTYHNVTTILEDTDPQLKKHYEHLVPTLTMMEELAAILHQKRTRRGAIQFDFPETSVLVNNQGEPIEIEKEERGVSNKMIEEFMLVANETVAEYAFWAEIPFVYRVHEAPSVEKILAFNDFARNFGVSFKGKIDKDTPVHPKALQQILDLVKGKPEERMISSTMLRSLMKAEYTTENLGHFGLASKYYCHFTSPIRRYPDLAIHRILKQFITNGIPKQKYDALQSFAQRAAKHSSECEVTAEHAERDVEDLMKAAYMANFIGETFQGVISGITGFGIFVELENSVEGMIRLDYIADDFYEFDETQHILIGQHTKRSYRIGDQVEIVVVQTDLMSRQIDFVLSKDYNKKLVKKITATAPVKSKKKPPAKIKKKKHKGKTKHGKI